MNSKAIIFLNFFGLSSIETSEKDASEKNAFNTIVR